MKIALKLTKLQGEGQFSMNMIPNVILFCRIKFKIFQTCLNFNCIVLKTFVELIAVNSNNKLLLFLIFMSYKETPKRKCVGFVHQYNHI